MKKTEIGKLTPQQVYLLDRIPRSYDMNGLKARPKPPEVLRAEKMIERFQKAETLRKCQQTKRNEALIRKAREAVYFADPKKALQIIQQCEKMLKGCEE